MIQEVLYFMIVQKTNLQPELWAADRMHNNNSILIPHMFLFILSGSWFTHIDILSLIGCGS